MRYISFHEVIIRFEHFGFKCFKKCMRIFLFFLFLARIEKTENEDIARKDG
jgi:hypothetical protein